MIPDNEALWDPSRCDGFVSLSDWKQDTWLSYKNANKSQRSSAFLHSNKELNKEKMLILKLLHFCLVLMLMSASITPKNHKGRLFFPPPSLLPELLLFCVMKVHKKLTKQTNKQKPPTNSRRQPVFPVVCPCFGVCLTDQQLLVVQ